MKYIEIKIKKKIKILRFKNNIINKIKTFFINDIIFKNNMK